VRVRAQADATVGNVPTVDAEALRGHGNQHEMTDGSSHFFHEERTIDAKSARRYAEVEGSYLATVYRVRTCSSAGVGAGPKTASKESGRATSQTFQPSCRRLHACPTYCSGGAAANAILQVVLVAVIEWLNSSYYFIGKYKTPCSPPCFQRSVWIGPPGLLGLLSSTLF
jgi:hypothetical protein